MKRLIFFGLCLTATAALAQQPRLSSSTPVRVPPPSIIVGDLEIYKDTDVFFGPMQNPDEGLIYRVTVNCETGLPTKQQPPWDKSMWFLVSKITYSADQERSGFLYGKLSSVSSLPIPLRYIFNKGEKYAIVPTIGIDIYPTPQVRAWAGFTGSTCEKKAELIAHNFYHYLKSVSRPAK